jgi:hypothetical protein
VTARDRPRADAAAGDGRREATEDGTRIDGRKTSMGEGTDKKKQKKLLLRAEQTPKNHNTLFFFFGALSGK